eukprot:768131-Rhodomonas_salina.1
MNLISNAVKFTEEGHVHVSARIELVDGQGLRFPPASNPILSHPIPSSLAGLPLMRALRSHLR